MPIAHQRIHTVVACAEAPELHLLAILDFFGVTVSPFHGNVRVGIGVHEYIEGAIAVQHGQKCHRRSNLTEDGLDLSLNLLIRLLLDWALRSAAEAVSARGHDMTTIFDCGIVKVTYSGAAFS